MAMIFSNAMQQQGTDLPILLCDAAGHLTVEGYERAEAINTPPSNPAGQVTPEGILQMLMEIKDQGLQVQWIPDTHPHADHFSAAQYLMPDDREPQWESTVREQRESTKHLAGGVNEADYVAMRDERDGELPMPKLILHSLQVNTLGGCLPVPEANGKRYLKIPLDALEGAAWDDGLPDGRAVIHRRIYIAK